MRTKKRILAFIIDYSIILLYIFILIGITLLVISSFNIETSTIHPFYGQMLGFTTLTLPVFLYAYRFEKSSHKGTIGKQLMKLEVISNSGSILKRNILKFLPWEIAHTGIYWMVYLSNKDHVPIWVWMLLIIPQIIVIIYFISIIISKGNSSSYDAISKTSVELITKST